MPAVTPIAGKFGSASLGLLIDGYNMLAGKPQGLRYKTGLVTQPSDGCGDAWKEHSPTGDRFAELAQEGAFFDTSAGNSHLALKDGVPTDPQTAHRLAVFWAAGNVAGRPFVGFQGVVQTDYEVLATRGTLQRANASAVVSGAAEDGAIVHAYGVESADANTEAASVDNTLIPQRNVPITSNSLANPSVVTCPVPHGLTTGDTVLIAGVITSNPTINGERTATVITPTTFSVPVNVTTAGTGGSFVRGKTNNGGSGYLNLTALTLGGHTNLVYTYRHSDDDSVFIDLVAHAARTAIGAERVTVAGAVRRYLAGAADFTGAGSPSATFFAGFARS